MRFPKSAARKRRLAVLRQTAPTDVDEAVDFSGPATVELPSEERVFLAACLSRLPLRLSVSNERTGETEEVIIDRPWAVIGGAEKCDLRILHPDVSQRHLYLQFAEGRLFCCDLASRTGTHWGNDSRSSRWVETGEPIYLGPYSIRAYPNDFLADEGELAAHPDGDAAAGDCPPVAFTIANVYDRAGRPKLRRLRRSVTLAGSSQVCHLRLSHASVGRAHCSFVWTSSGLWVIDLLCAGGTLVNGKSVSLAHLREGDEIGIGRFQLHVTYAPLLEDEPEVSAKAESSGEIPAAIPERPADPKTVENVSPPPIVFASADPEPELALATTDAEPVAEGVAKPVVEAVAAIAPQPAQESTPAPAGDLSSAAANGLMHVPSVPPPLAPQQLLADPFAVAVMQQFSAMQREHFDETRQLLAAMTQAFGPVHARQLELIQGELVRVHEITRELQELDLGRALGRYVDRENSGLPALPLPTAPVDRMPLRSPRSGTSRGPTDKPIPPRTGIGWNGQAVPRPMASPTDAAGAPSEDCTGNRLRELEEERTTCWQRIMQILSRAGE